MNRDGEEFLSVEQPVVEVPAGQKVAGWVLRVMGVVVFLAGGLGMTFAFVMLEVAWLHDVLVDMDPWWVLPSFLLGGVGVAAVGTAMGVFGMVVAGSLPDLRGELFVRWSLVVLVRNLSLLCGALILAIGVSGAWVMREPGLLVLLVPVAGLMILGWCGGRWMERVKGGG